MSTAKWQNIDGGSKQKFTLKTEKHQKPCHALSIMRTCFLVDIELIKIWEKYCKQISGSCHIRIVLIVVEFRNCCGTLDVYLLFAIRMGQIQLRLKYTFLTYMDWPVCKLQVCNIVLI